MPFNADENQQNKNSNNPAENGNQDQISLKGSGGGSSGSGRTSGFSTGSNPAQSTGSGRFTNLSKYMGANQGAGERIGNKIDNSYNKDYQKKTSDINSQNENINNDINMGKSAINEGQGFNSKLSDIGDSLNSFKSMEDRSKFDTGVQDAQSFGQAPTFGRFQQIQQGNAINNDEINNKQLNASTAGNALTNQAQTMYNKINTEQGRNDLMRNNFGGNQGNYSYGGSRLDNLLFQGSNSVNNLKNNFNDRNLKANQLLSNINQQGNNVNSLLSDENSLVGNINNQAQKNQDIFNSKLGDQSNIDFINKLRSTKHDEAVAALKSGSIDASTADILGLNNINTYSKGQMINPIDVSGTVDAQGNPVGNQSNVPRNLTAYNSDVGNLANQYLVKGRVAQNMQDITTDNDYAGYKALQNIANRDTGKLSGASTLEAAVQAGKAGDKTLAQKIAEDDANYRKNYAGKNYSAATTATQSHYGDGSNAGEVGQGVDYLGEGVTDFWKHHNDVVNSNQGADNIYGNRREHTGSGATSTSNANIEDYRNNNLVNTEKYKAWDRGGDSESNRAAEAAAEGLSNSSLRSYLDNIINTTGARNNLNITGNTAEADAKNARYNKYNRLINGK